jgi:predicted amidohydrolase
MTAALVSLNVPRGPRALLGPAVLGMAPYPLEWPPWHNLGMRDTTIEKLGFYNFVNFEQPPIDSLQTALERAIEKERSLNPEWEVSGSLIVLPEACNIGNYLQPVLEPRAEAFHEALQKLAGHLQVTFIAGILERRLNSAYMIDADGSQLMCHKIGEDLSRLYDPCANPDRCNPIFLKNASVAALICMDATENAPGHLKCRRDALLDRLEADAGSVGTKIICIPGRFSLTNPKSLSHFQRSPNCWYIIADGVWKHDHGSFIADASHKILLEPADGRENEVRFCSLPPRAIEWPAVETGCGDAYGGAYSE